MKRTFTGETKISRGGRDHFAIVTLEGQQTDGPSFVEFEAQAIAYLQNNLPNHYQEAKETITSTIYGHLGITNENLSKVDGGRSIFFKIKVLTVSISPFHDEDVTLFSLMMSTIDAYCEFIDYWKISVSYN